MSVSEGETVFKMKLQEEVHTGVIKFGDEKTILRAVGIGSCVVAAVADLKAPRGSMAHIMLPGKPPAHRRERIGRYARPALERLIKLLWENGSRSKDLRVVLAGGANVLAEEGKDIGKQNIRSVKEILNQMCLPVVAESLAGRRRRSVTFDVQTGGIHCAIGNEKPQLLWQRKEISD